MNKEKLAMALEFAKENALTSIEVDGIKIDLSHAFVPVELPDDGKDLKQPETPYDQLTDEEILFWSTPTYDEILARKTQREENIKNGEVMDD